MWVRGLAGGAFSIPQTKVMLALTVTKPIFKYLSHPLVLDLSNLGVGVTHHGNQQVDQQHKHNRQEEEAKNLENK